MESRYQKRIAAVRKALIRRNIVIIKEEEHKCAHSFVLENHGLIASELSCIAHIGHTGVSLYHLDYDVFLCVNVFDINVE